MMDWCERWLPLVAAAAAALAWAAVRALGWGAQLAEQIEFGQVVSVSFNVIAFAAPVTIALFAITLSPGDGFIRRLHGTKTYALFVGYAIQALVLGLVALLASGIFLVAKEGSALEGVLAHSRGFWFALIAAAGAAIVRVLGIFLFWARSYTAPKKVAERRAGLRAPALQ